MILKNNPKQPATSIIILRLAPVGDVGGVALVISFRYSIDLPEAAENSLSSEI
jgi:hypothetical protein